MAVKKFCSLLSESDDKFSQLLKVLIYTNDEGQGCSDQDIRDILNNTRPNWGEQSRLLLSKEELTRIEKYHTDLYQRWNAWFK